jgi:hypothetical protein
MTYVAAKVRLFDVGDQVAQRVLQHPRGHAGDFTRLRGRGFTRSYRLLTVVVLLDHNLRSKLSITKGTSKINTT